MAWTSPRTWVSGEVVTHTLLNTHVRDNLLETAPAKVTTAGDTVYATAASTLARLAIGAAGSVYHVSGGIPAWTTSPSLTALTLSGALTVNGVGPHAIGGATADNVQLYLRGTFPGSGVASPERGIFMQQNISPTANQPGIGWDVEPTINEAASGTHSLIAAIRIGMVITAAAAAVTDLVGLEILTFAANAGTTNAVGLRIAAPTGATNNYALWVDSGNALFDANLRAESVGVGVAASGVAGRLTVNENLLVTGVGAHAIGGAAANNVQLYLRGTFAPSGVASTERAVFGQQNISPTAGQSGIAWDLQPTINEATGSTHALIAGIQLTLTIVAGAGNVTDAAGIDIVTFGANATTTTATGLRVAAPTGATNNYAINITSGDIHKAGTAYTNPAYVFEHWATGSITRYADRDGASEYTGLRMLTTVRNFVREHHELPLMTLKPKGGLFDRGDLLLASLEESYLYLFNHEDRLARLEARQR